MPVTDTDLAIDRELAEVCGAVPLLRYVNPVNIPEAREQFFSGNDPQFEYRPLPDLEEVSERLDRIEPEKAEDPVLGHMAEGLARELRLRVEMFAHRGTERFFLAAVEMFGHVDEPILGLAGQILEDTAGRERSRETVGAAEFAAAARAEIGRLASQHPEMTAQVRSAEPGGGVRVEAGNLYVPSDVRIAVERVEPLIQHEVGTHVLTYENGRAQPLKMLSLGLAGYEELQEALGVLAEHLTGGLPASRLRVLAYRVLAAHYRGEQAEFREAFDALRERGASKGLAFTTVMRAYRGGGMTKDAVYLRGLARLLDHLAAGGDLEGMLVGKMSFESIPLVEDLLERGVLSQPALTPSYLATDGTSERLAEIRDGAGVIELGRVAA